jgi:hypothetical protein
MYEPPPISNAQWSADQPGEGVSSDPFANASPPPPAGRQYVMYRQPPSVQHASIMQGFGGFTAADALASLVSNATMIAAGALVGYLFTGTWKGAVGGGAAVSGAAQLPFILRPGGLMRAGMAAAGLGIAYWCLKNEAPVLQQWATRNGEDDDEDDEDFDRNDDEDDDEPVGDEGAQPSADTREPAKSAPWMHEVT